MTKYSNHPYSHDVRNIIHIYFESVSVEGVQVIVICIKVCILPQSVKETTYKN